MKYLLFLPFIAICLAFDIGEKSPESTPEYEVTAVKPDANLPKGTGMIVFNFYDENGFTHDSIRMSYNGVEKKVLPTQKGKVYLSVKGGNYKFQFYLDSEHYEVYTDSINIQLMHQTSISVWFMNSTIPVIAEKPVIYVYPDKTQHVNIQLDVNGKLGFTYPAYNSGWDFTADPDGTIHMNDKIYSYLFWDGEANVSLGEKERQSGFIVQRDSLVTFFEDKLTVMGLNAREQEDFITYWCPRMTFYQSCFVHFIFNDDYDKVSTMNITPEPDHLFRVFMVWSGSMEAGTQTVLSQEIPTAQRDGFTVIEWGGAEISAQFAVTSAQ